MLTHNACLRVTIGIQTGYISEKSPSNLLLVLMPMLLCDNWELFIWLANKICIENAVALPHESTLIIAHGNY